MSDEDTKTTRVFGLREMREFAEDHADPMVRAIWGRLEDARSKIAIWCEEMNRLEARFKTLKLTDAEREAIEGVLTGRDHLVIHDVWKDEWKQNCDTLRGLLTRYEEDSKNA